MSVTAEPLDIDRIVAALDGCESVAGRSRGPLGTAVAYLPGRQVPGLRLVGTVVEVHVVARWSVTARELDAEVRDALRSLCRGHRLDVFIEDVETPTPGRV